MKRTNKYKKKKYLILVMLILYGWYGFTAIIKPMNGTDAQQQQYS